MKPIIIKKDYMKWGFLPTRFQAFLCPNCKTILNAGPEYQPKFCAECGIKLDFTGIVYEKEEHIA